MRETATGAKTVAAQLRHVLDQLDAGNVLIVPLRQVSNPHKALMFERPQKNDVDTALSLLMHESRHKLMDEVNRIKGEAIKAGALQSNRVVVAAVKAADDVHKEAMEQAHTILLDFIERMERAPTEIIAWARPHLENLNNSVLGVAPPNNFPQDHQRLTHQYRTVFQQRLDIMLRNVEIGHQKGAGFARAAKVESKEEWISAAGAVQLLARGPKDEYTAKMTLCKRAHAGLVRARAQRFVVGGTARDNVELPAVFWWAEGHEALHQNWIAGDFDTWLSGGEVHLEAFNVSFLRSAVEKMIPPDVSPADPASNQAAQSAQARNKGGIYFTPSVFQIPTTECEPDLLSVMMPFGAGFAAVHTAVIEAAGRNDMRCQRADDIWVHSTVIQDVFSLIYRSYIVVCDFTGKNPNVFYEAGIAHTLGKHVIPITQYPGDIPFDLQAHRYLQYHDNAQGHAKLTNDLSQRIETLRNLAQ